MQFVVVFKVMVFSCLQRPPRILRIPVKLKQNGKIIPGWEGATSKVNMVAAFPGSGN